MTTDGEVAPTHYWPAAANGRYTMRREQKLSDGSYSVEDVEGSWDLASNQLLLTIAGGTKTYGGRGSFSATPISPGSTDSPKFAESGEGTLRLDGPPQSLKCTLARAAP